MSAVADHSRRADAASPWDRLDRAAEDAVVAVVLWRRRAAEAEAEVLRLRRALEELASDHDHPRDLEEEVRRLRAENAALRSRMLEARNRVGSLMRRLLSLGIEP